MRGKVQYRVTGQQSIGITPAYAGKSVVKSDIDGVTKDHPRVCGEKTKKIP